MAPGRLKDADGHDPRIGGPGAGTGFSAPTGGPGAARRWWWFGWMRVGGFE